MIDDAQPERPDSLTPTTVHRVGEGCVDLDAYPAITTTPDPVCQECLDEGLVWVSLRQCLECGNVGCCDSSPARHATGHFHDTTHPVMQSAEPDENWRWCYVHHATA
jgi:CPA1 family monovalent cation:H+ antiporter